MPDSLAGAECLVLGGGGFLGAHLCEALVGAGARVRAFGRRQAYPDALAGTIWIGAEFGDRAALARAVEGVDFVFHLLAGTWPESSNQDPAGDLAGAVLPTLHLLEICRTARVRRVLFASSGGTVYGVPHRLPIDEDAPTDPISAYGIGKLAIEKYGALYRHVHGLDLVSLRISNAFGPYQDPHRRQGVIAAMADAVLAGRPVEIWGDGGVVRDYVFAPDVCAAFLQAARSDGSARVVNVGSGVGRSLLDVLDAIGAAAGVPLPARLHKPGRPADVPANVLDIGLARRALPWTPATPWPEALAATIAWLRARRGG